MRTKVLLSIIGLLVILIALSTGCSISINTQKPKIDTVYVEKYWGSDVKIDPAWDNPPTIVHPVYRIKDTLLYTKPKSYNLPYPLGERDEFVINGDKWDTTIITHHEIDTSETEKFPTPPNFEDYKVHEFMSGNVKYYYQYLSNLDYSIWRK